MKNPNFELIVAIRKTIKKLKSGASYQWGHMGACNCGNLAQELIQISREDIHRFAMQKSGDWNEQLTDYCPSSGYPMDLMITKMVEKGINIEALRHLEKLSDPKILAHIPLVRRNNLEKNSLQDVIFYFETWLKILKDQWVESELTTDSLRFQKNISVKVFA